MDNKQPQQEPSTNRKNYPAVIGFVLALLGSMSYGLTAVPALILSLIGIRHKKHKKLAVAGIVISLCLLFLQVLFITPMGSVPYPLNLLKYRIVCRSHFWLAFDAKHMVDAQSQRTVLLLGSLGSIYFNAERQNLYDSNEVISYAAKNGWVYGGKLHLSREDFSEFYADQSNLLNENEDLWRAIHEITGYIRSPLWIKDDCTVLAFDAGNVHGLPSYVMINDNKSQMAIYANHGAFPDPGYPFTLPPLFEKAQE